MSLPQEKTRRCIEMAITELRSTTAALEIAAVGKRSFLIEPDNSNGLRPSLGAYELAFRYPDSPNLLSDEGSAKLSELQDCWNRFFRLMSSLCSNRELCREAENRQRQVHSACRDALSGRHACDERAVLDDFRNALTALANALSESDEESARPKSKQKNKGRRRIRAKEGELTQEDVAEDFGVKRKTVIKWEREQTEDGPNNKSNPYGYYQRLRIDPNLRGAYTVLVKAVKHYLAEKAEAKKRGIRFRVTFERFNEEFAKHNKKL